MHESLARAKELFWRFRSRSTVPLHKNVAPNKKHAILGCGPALWNEVACSWRSGVWFACRSGRFDSVPIEIAFPASRSLGSAVISCSRLDAQCWKVARNYQRDSDLFPFSIMSRTIRTIAKDVLVA